MPWLIPTLIVVAGLIALLIGAKPLLRWVQQIEARRAVQRFRIQRETLEAKFFDVASATGKPRGLRWKRCDWQAPVTFARDLQSQLVTAFVSVEIHFDAIEGGDMEDVEAVGTIRDAAAVFHYRAGTWGTGGKALFNMNPSEAVQRLEGQFEPLNIEV
ncbi:hypothetical protein Mal4_31320 [Maioricimonas rarisocia]|uniref:Uncharacterized protein n=1 Tax=Maioricimonas rarisocia TaxID=2528026 RepID=A0A517Z8J2_9PLAN|nr:hypothetical protein [Maioricimonas rarisocia]QDU38802.1 hypothetical protein Mal4_31320 [Maioricimonas rarisocia]